MGTHISKVKSIDLDSWTAEQVENMIKWGNEKANKYWEERLPASSIPNENTSGIDPWIRSKYEWKLFASKGPVPDPAGLGPVDEAMLADLHGQLGARLRVHMERPSEPGSFGIIAPPPSTPTRPSAHKSTMKSPAGEQGGDLVSIGQPQQQQQRPRPATLQEDFFGLNEPTPNSSTIPAATQNQTQVNNKRASVPSQPHQQQQSSGTAQDLFSLNASPTTPAPSGHVANAASPVQQAKPGGNADWKNSIMSLYGNQNSAGNRTSTGFSIGQQQQQQRPQSGQFNQGQGVNSFGYGQQQPHPYQQQQHHQQQQYPQQQQHQQQLGLWGANNNNGLGNMQQAAPSFGSGYNNGDGFGGQTQSSTNSRPMSGNFGHNSNNQQGGDFFDMIASATKSPVSSPPAQNNKSSSAFGDLSWK
ncbi:hypothetical protein KI688_003871 [Linnemannia hyalina]|uniref:Arf-GAP domain-containing protein n=1 Tax=Linnemannia hyalina TaxID=64524 RepID=A0A9P8BPE9_9FUNG|nr:hypothetical protein KI688_003871 [Linnemannia hyalina]